MLGSGYPVFAVESGVKGGSSGPLTSIPRSTAAMFRYLQGEPEVLWFEQQKELKRNKRDLNEEIFDPSHRAPSIHDPLFQKQWFINGGAYDGTDMNVIPAWQKGITGKGVVVTILDDGIQRDHPDLKQNYDPDASTDINGGDKDPMPQDNGDNKHGTRCAGEVAAVAFKQKVFSHYVWSAVYKKCQKWF